MTLCRAVSFKAIKQPQKCRQNRFRKIAGTAIHIESKQSQTKKQNILLFTSINISLYIAHNNIINTSQKFKHIHAATFTMLNIYVTQSTQERTNDTENSSTELLLTVFNSRQNKMPYF